MKHPETLVALSVWREVQKSGKQIATRNGKPRLFHSFFWVAPQSRPARSIHLAARHRRAAVGPTREEKQEGQVDGRAPLC